MKQAFLLITFLLMSMIVLADYELDWPEVDIEEFNASCIQSALESTGRLNASELANLEASCVCYAEVLDFLFSYEDFLVNTEEIMTTLVDPVIEVCSTRLSLTSNE
ncbi:MAG: hypothetical protein HN867_03750 [Deltaproteobacteria bacterium]|jgi:hypothetical protein|nr:hypothetical protein [Deltaproteobacteria bacterium]